MEIELTNYFTDMSEELKKNGLFEEYYKNGQLKIKGDYKNGIKDGYFEFYYENGQLWIEAMPKVVL